MKTIPQLRLTCALRLRATSLAVLAGCLASDIVATRAAQPSLEPVTNYCASCESILFTGRSTGSGYYDISPDGVAVINAYCNMTNGHGWTIIDPAHDTNWGRFFVVWNLYAGGLAYGNGISCSSWRQWFTLADQETRFATSPNGKDIELEGIIYRMTGNFYGCVWHNRNCDFDGQVRLCHPFGSSCQTNEGTNPWSDGAHCNGAGPSYTPDETYCAECSFDWWNSAPSIGADGTHCVAYLPVFRDPLDQFIFKQMDRFNSIRPPGQPPLVQSYDCYPSSDQDNYYRGDVYDQGVAICYLLARGHILRAKQLADALLYLQDHDRIPDGRLHAAYWPNNLLSPDGSESSIKDPNISPGNMSWAGIGLVKTFVVTGEEKYLVGAQRCADWILNNLKRTSGPGGFSGGLLGWDYTPAQWRSTEHNIDVYVLATSLFNLTQDQKWQSVAECAAGFVQAMFTNAPSPGHYFTGTVSDGVTVNPSPIPADSQSWSALAYLDTAEHATNALAWLWTNLLVSCVSGTNKFEGIEFSDTGSGVSSDATAGAAMAFCLSGDSARAAGLLADLQRIRLLTASCQTNGIVAGPCDGCTETGFFTEAGDPICIANKPHVASSAWSGLAALVANGDSTANPLKPIPGTPLRISQQAATVCLSWPSISGTNYSILVSSNIAESLNNWNVIPVGQTNRWSDPKNLQSESRFYRLKVK